MKNHWIISRQHGIETTMEDRIRLGDDASPINEINNFGTYFSNHDRHDGPDMITQGYEAYNSMGEFLFVIRGDGEAYVLNRDGTRLRDL